MRDAGDAAVKSGGEDPGRTQQQKRVAENDVLVAGMRAGLRPHTQFGPLTRHGPRPFVFLSR